VKISQRGRRIVFGCAATLILISFLWFIGITESAYYEVCTRCDSRRITVETRGFGVLISTRFHSERETFDARIANDLGVPCPHSFVRALVARWRGLLLPTVDQNLPSRLFYDTPKWYKKNASAIVAGLKSKNPALPQEFRERVLLKRDYEYLRQLIRSMQQFCPREDWED